MDGQGWFPFDVEIEAGNQRSTASVRCLCKQTRDGVVGQTGRWSLESSVENTLLTAADIGAPPSDVSVSAGSFI